MKIVQCQHCDVKNRIKDYSLKFAAVCGNCGKSLPEPLALKAARWGNRYKYWLVLGLIIASSLLVDASHPQKSPALPKQQNTANLPVISITQGIDRVYTTASLIAPLQIVTPPGPDKYYVKLVDAVTGAIVMTFFVNGGESFEADVPLGIYRVKYASGLTWYGAEHLFGPGTRYSEADKTFEFALQGNQISGYTLELIQQRGGNLHTKSISAAQF